jgi:hypothetical protein
LLSDNIANNIEKFAGTKLRQFCAEISHERLPRRIPDFLVDMLLTAPIDRGLTPKLFARNRIVLGLCRGILA